MSKRRMWNATSFDRFLSAVDNNPESFELFIQYLRDADDGKQAQHVHSHSEVTDLKASSLTRPKRKECERHLISLWHAPLKRSNQLNELWALYWQGRQNVGVPTQPTLKSHSFLSETSGRQSDSWVDSRWNRIWSQRSFEDVDYFDLYT